MVAVKEVDEVLSGDVLEDESIDRVSFNDLIPLEARPLVLKLVDSGYRPVTSIDGGWRFKRFLCNLMGNPSEGVDLVSEVLFPENDVVRADIGFYFEPVNERAGELLRHGFERGIADKLLKCEFARDWYAARHGNPFTDFFHVDSKGRGYVGFSVGSDYDFLGGHLSELSDLCRYFNNLTRFRVVPVTSPDYCTVFPDVKENNAIMEGWSDDLREKYPGLMNAKD